MSVLPDGPFTLSMAKAGGLSEQRLRTLLRAGSVRRLLHGVYADACQPNDLHQRAAAIALVLPPGAVICRTSAAWLYGVDVAAPGDVRPRLGALQILVDAARAPIRRPGVIGYASVDLVPTDLTDLEGVPVTTPLRTALDCGPLLPRFAAVAAVDALLHSGHLDVAALADGVERFAGRRNVRQLRWVADIAEPLSESPMESWTRARLVDGGLPRPTAQISVERPHDAVPYRLDLGYEKYLVAVEYDGAEHHSSQEARRRDALRRDWIETQRGWRILVAGERDVLRGWLLLVRATADALMTRGWVPPQGSTFLA